MRTRRPVSVMPENAMNRGAAGREERIPGDAGRIPAASRQRTSHMQRDRFPPGMMFPDRRRIVIGNDAVVRVKRSRRDAAEIHLLLIFIGGHRLIADVDQDPFILDFRRNRRDFLRRNPPERARVGVNNIAEGADFLVRTVQRRRPVI